ncbi:MAG: DUF4416 family protein [Fibrobacteres bacterium]|nr:DUF4416 family protein [Fibrobacterota bacterium]
MKFAVCVGISDICLMNNIKKKPVAVKLFCGLLLSERADLNELLEKLECVYGPHDVVSNIMDFSSYSDYYEDELGKIVRRCFVSFKNLIDRTALPDIKLNTIDIENTFSENGKRIFNIDPGYLALGQVFLASTKDNFCRIYIRDGIYEEVTLRFIKESYTPFAYTYKDYRSEEYASFFNEVRKIYKEQLH